MNLSSNMLEIGEAVTPIGIKAIQEIDKKREKNTGQYESTPCPFRNFRQLTHITSIVLRTKGGNVTPTDIILSTLIGISVSTML